MQTHEIPNQQWGEFFDNLSRRHEGEKVSVEIQSMSIGSQPQAEAMRLIGISFDPKDSIGEEIDVIVRCNAREHLMHAIPHPSHVRIAQTDDGRDAALELESDDGPTTLVRFNLAPMGPEGDASSNSAAPA